jgi:transcriptional regulator with XRE-family HTH domain
LFYAASMPNDVVELARVRALARNGTARTIRVAAGISLGELAKSVGVDRSTILRWESGERRPRGAAALRYAQTVRDLLGEAV